MALLLTHGDARANAITHSCSQYPSSSSLLALWGKSTPSHPPFICPHSTSPPPVAADVPRSVAYHLLPPPHPLLHHSPPPHNLLRLPAPSFHPAPLKACSPKKEDFNIQILLRNVCILTQHFSILCLEKNSICHQCRRVAVKIMCASYITPLFSNINLHERDATCKLQMKLYSRRGHIGSADCSHECLICEALKGIKPVKPPPTPPG